MAAASQPDRRTPRSPRPGAWLACLLIVSIVAACASAIAWASSGLGPLITEPDQGYAPIYTLLGSAKHTLDVTMYEFSDPAAEKALIDDAARGVAVRVILDEQYKGGAYNKPVFTNLSQHGVKVQWASTHVSITHQKSFVIDGKKAVIMTGNLTSSFYSTSRDFALVDTKKSDVAAIEAVFGLDWANGKGTAPAGADLVWSPGSEAPLVALIGSAKHSLLVENEEMEAPAIVGALEAAAKRGVAVQVVMTNSPDWKASFDALKAAGVQVHTYKNSSKTLYIHAKLIEADASRVFLGSENFSVGSLQYNRELGLITTSAPILQAVKKIFASDFSGATPW